MSDTLAETQAWLHGAFPLVAEMGLELLELAPGHAVTRTPLARNRNVHGTAFAGSLSAQAMLTGWIVLVRDLDEARLDAVLVQREATVRYHAPITGDPVCRCTLPAERLAAFRAALLEHGRARLDADVEILDATNAAALLTAGYSARIREPD